MRVGGFGEGVGWIDEAPHLHPASQPASQLFIPASAKGTAPPAVCLSWHAAFSIFRRVFPWNDVHLPRIRVALIAVLSACCNTTLCADLSPKDPAHCLFSPHSSGGIQKFPKTLSS